MATNPSGDMAHDSPLGPLSSALSPRIVEIIYEAAGAAVDFRHALMRATQRPDVAVVAAPCTGVVE
eukprot:3042345-Lingulodinium_polyedra.AAC.1